MLGQLVSSVVALVAHAAEHLFIQTFPVDQSILGLCSTRPGVSEDDGRSAMPVTWKVDRSK